MDEDRKEKSNTYKCLIIGDSGVGKSTFMCRQATGVFETNHQPTEAVCVHTMEFQTNYQNLQLELWDTAGDARFGGLQNGYYLHGQCALIMFDLSRPQTAYTVYCWQGRVREICGDETPIVVCGNKADLTHEMPLIYRKQPQFAYCEMSVSNCWNLQKPFELLANMLFGKTDVRLVSEPQVISKINISSSLRKNMERHLKEVDDRARALMQKMQEKSDESEITSECIVLN